jgi:hypothetical protein
MPFLGLSSIHSPPLYARPGRARRAILRYYAAMSTVADAVSHQAEPRGFHRLWRVLKQLFHEAVGASFAVLALGWFNSALRAWTRDAADWLIVVSLAVGVLFVAFSVTSFRRASRL